MIYLVGGPSRCGKTTLARKVRKIFNAQSVSGDAIVRSLKNVLEPDWAPDIFDKIHNPVSHTDPHDKQVDRLRQRDKYMWKFATEYITSVEYDGNDNVVFEGGLWPDFDIHFDVPFVAVFLVDTSIDRAAKLIAMRDHPDTQNNWMQAGGWSDETITRWAQFDVYRSQQIIELCKKYHYQYFDIADWGIEHAQDLALEYFRTHAPKRV
jgi:cytidylate kinase